MNDDTIRRHVMESLAESGWTLSHLPVIEGVKTAIEKQGYAHLPDGSVIINVNNDDKS